MEAGISDTGFPRAQGEEGNECISQLSSAVERRHSDVSYKICIKYFAELRLRFYGVTQRMKNVGTDGTKKKEGEANGC